MEYEEPPLGAYLKVVHSPVSGEEVTLEDREQTQSCRNSSTNIPDFSLRLAVLGNWKHEENGGHGRYACAVNVEAALRPCEVDLLRHCSSYTVKVPSKSWYTASCYLRALVIAFAYH
jgi:hypothetical protein